MLDNDEAVVDLPGDDVVSLYAGYTPRSVEGFEVDNFFDETCSSRSSDGIDVPNVVPLTEPGRAVKLTPRYRF
ncbi:hypothetical protein [Alloyangia pacifica]|uniref:TonB-dependent receptor n=1 Tax=Alloyangia pacifica TaxID=311180 RepID=A0A1I6SXQ5_9RHOB|nr:hypothetical protein [Alloyangia pacifica]SDG90750.1 hypothetical protein SAMN04488245_105127 [Alloyangia pacifica]SFS81673.1 hypothetical protein SAMN04488050_105127 [Alloyangia pacifica]